MMIDGQLMKKKNVVCKPSDETTESYWRQMAEEYRTKLDEVTRENEQVCPVIIPLILILLLAS